MKNFLCGLTVLALGTVPAATSYANFTDQEDSRQCKQAKPDITDCTLIRRIGLQDPDTGEISYVYKNWGKDFKKSAQKSIYKLQGIETKGVDFPKRSSTRYFGLREPNGKEILSTSFQYVYPISSRYSFVRMNLEGDNRYKMIEHYSHTMQPLPIGWKSLYQFRSSDDVLNTWVKTVDHGDDIGTWRRVNPDLTLGLTIDNVAFTDKGPFKSDIPGFSNIGAQGVAVTKEPQTGALGSVVFSMTEDIIDPTKAAGIFQVERADNYGKKFTSNVTMTKLDAQLPNIGDTFPRDIYWPMDPSGRELPRSKDVLGMAPMINSINEVRSWLIVQANGHDLNYLIGVEKYGNATRPIEILKRVDELEAFDDIYFFGRHNDYAVKDKDGPPLNPWRVSSHTAYNQRHATNISVRDFFSSGPAVDAGVEASREKTEQDRMVARQRNAEKHEYVTNEIERLLGNIQTSARIAECEMIGNYANRLGSPSLDARNWLEVRRLDSYRSCRHIPVRLANEARAANATTGTTAPTLSDMLEQVGRDIAKAPTVLRCTSNGDGTETCQWVNR